MDSVSSMVGTGIFSVPSSIISSVGSPGAAIMLWVVGFVLSFCGMFVWLELGCLYPQSGGEKVYLGIAYPRPRLLALTLYTIMALFLSTPGTYDIRHTRSSLDSSLTPEQQQGVWSSPRILL
jgi:amino acid transporter